VEADYGLYHRGCIREREGDWCPEYPELGAEESEGIFNDSTCAAKSIVVYLLGSAVMIV
jgi:hypothetical protein